MCVTVRPIYDVLLVILGPEEFLFSFTDDVYMGGVPWNVALALDAASALYAMIGLSLRWGPRKAELQILVDCDLNNLHLPRDDSGRPLLEVVNGFKACLGVPRHSNNCSRFITKALQPLVKRHDSMLDLVAGVSEEDPFVALRLLKVYGVNMFGHVLSANPPDVAAAFCEDRDAAIAAALGAILGVPVDPCMSTHTLPVVAGGAGLPSLQKLAPASYPEAFFRVAGPLTARLTQMGGTTTTRAATLVADLVVVRSSYA